MNMYYILILIVLISIGCSSFKPKDVPFIPEEYPYECGPRCLQMIFKYYDVNIEFNELATQAQMTREQGTSFLTLSEAAEFYDFKSLAVKIGYESDDESLGLIDVPHPSIAHWQNNYFIIVESVSKKYVNIIHPRNGKRKLTKEEFISNWFVPDENLGLLLLLEKN